MTCVTPIAFAITRPLGMLAMSRHGKLRVLISLSALIAAIGSVTSLTPVGGWNAGQASFYGGQPDGACIVVHTRSRFPTGACVEITSAQTMGTHARRY
jgi:hypothetical protein